VISEAIGDGWIGDLGQLERLTPLAGDAPFRAAIRRARREAKVAWSDWLAASAGRRGGPGSIFGSPMKRIHEYKRQLLNALHIVVLYQRLRDNPAGDAVPRTFFFAGKAAPAYAFAKLVIKFINNLASAIDADPSVNGRLTVVFVPDYGV